MNKKDLLRKMREVVKHHQKQGQKGFTLLELLIVVAILAAIAATTTIALKDLDARAAAAAHVAIMDELDKGIRTYEAIPGLGGYPNNFDSLFQISTATFNTTTGVMDTMGAAPVALELLATDDTTFKAMSLNGGAVAALAEAGITDLRVVYNNAAFDPGGADDVEDCSDLPAVIQSTDNMVTVNNIYLGEGGNGCGAQYPITNATVNNSNVMIWTGGSERVTGEYVEVDITDGHIPGVGATAIDNTTVLTEGAPVIAVFGIGPASTLFGSGTPGIGAGGPDGLLATCPYYRHVGPLEYNRFLALFKIGKVAAAETDNYSPMGGAIFLGVVDSAGDTAEEELGEWDGTRAT